MSIGRVSDIGNLDEIEEDELANSSAADLDTSAKISELASKFGLLDAHFSDDLEEGKGLNKFTIFKIFFIVYTHFMYEM